MPRGWGFWTRHKLDILERYLDRFTTTTKYKSPTARVYLDLFGGEPENYDRLTHDPIDGSARIALDVADPQFSHLRFFELDGNAAKLEESLRRDYPDRNWHVYPGNSNDTIHQALADLHTADLAWAPTFAFIDPNGPHYTWRTLRALATHKPQRSKTKVELWMLFPGPLFGRLLPRTGDLRPDDDEAITDMFGTSAWHATWEAKLDGTISPSEAQAEYVDLMRWRLETELGYAWTHQLEVRNEQNRPIYRMVFATDSDAGHRIMSDLYDKAASEFPQMLAEARDTRRKIEHEKAGQYDLFSAFGIEEQRSPSVRPDEKLYIHERPEEPRHHDASTCAYCS